MQIAELIKPIQPWDRDKLIEPKCKKEAMKKLQREVAKLKKSQENMGGYINSKIINHSDAEGYEEYNNLNYDNLDALYTNEEHFQGDD